MPYFSEEQLRQEAAKALGVPLEELTNEKAEAELCRLAAEKESIMFGPSPYPPTPKPPFDFLKEVRKEVERAESKHPKFPTMHHGLAVIWEEFDELKQEIFKKVPDKVNLKDELVQTAAMCLRFYNDLLKEEVDGCQSH